MSTVARPTQRTISSEHDACAVELEAPVSERLRAPIDGEFASAQRESPAPGEPVQ
jgi:hypothetical protein